MKKTIKIIWKVIYYTQLILFISFLALVLYIFVKPDNVVNSLAHFTVKEDLLKKADVIVVIGGEEQKLRTEYGIELFKQGYAPFIIFSGMGNEDYIHQLLDKNQISNSQYMFESTATTTFENANNLVQYVKNNNIHSVILVSSPVQSRRSRFMFNKVFPKEQIICTYSPDSLYDPDKIFADKTIREQLNDEMMKSFYYYVKYAFY